MQHPDISLIFVHALNAARAYLEERGAIPVFAYVLLAPRRTNYDGSFPTQPQGSERRKSSRNSAFS
jgi:hypothetical protein